LHRGRRGTAPVRRKEPRAALRRSATHGDRRPGGLSIATIGAFVLMRCEGENAR
jgi:hypothetical protein